MPLLNRRDFIQAACIGGAGLVLGEACRRDEPVGDGSVPLTSMPLRRLGRTGVDLPILMFGGGDLLPSSTILLREALKYGVTAWETAYDYGNGNSELTMGAYLERFPEDRPKIFIITKTYDYHPSGLTEQLGRSLERMKTDYVDLYLLHGPSHPEDLLTESMRQWVDDVKAKGRIRHFGYSTHEDMAPALRLAARTSWIDAVLATCSYRNMMDADYKAAFEECVDAGVGFIAMKTQAIEALKVEQQTERELFVQLSELGYTKGQARLKALWADPRIASICCRMTSVQQLKENIAAALNRNTLAAAEMDVLHSYARATRSCWCAACGACRAASGLPIPGVLRGLMYHRGYNDPRAARALFREIGVGRIDPSSEAVLRAEAACPGKIPIREALIEAIRLVGVDRA